MFHIVDDQVRGKVLDQAEGENWKLFLGDSIPTIGGIPDRSIDFTIFSPPFSNLYIYSDSQSDMGNTVDLDEFMDHFGYLVPEIYRTTKEGRLCAIHCKDLPLYHNRDGAAGLVDFPGQCIRLFEQHGWTFHSRVTIWKCPVTERERTNNNGLLHKTVMRDRSQIRQGMADYLIIFRRTPEGSLLSEKPLESTNGFTEYVGELDPRESNAHPSPYSRKSMVRTDLPPDAELLDDEEIARLKNSIRTKQSIRIWQRYAEPVWWDVNQTDVLNFKQARDEQDEKHICPLQKGVIDRAIQLWSDPGEVVASWFAGIGSEGDGAIRAGRKFVGCELKRSYWKDACKYLAKAVESTKSRERSLFEFVGEDA